MPWEIPLHGEFLLCLLNWNRFLFSHFFFFKHVSQSQLKSDYPPKAKREKITLWSLQKDSLRLKCPNIYTFFCWNILIEVEVSKFTIWKKNTFLSKKPKFYSKKPQRLIFFCLFFFARIQPKQHTVGFPRPSHIH